MHNIAENYYPVLLFFGIACGLSVVMIAASYLLAAQKPDHEKNMPYECGFNPFTHAPGRFDIRFYLVAILFLIFDLEIAFLFPWAITLSATGLIGFVSMCIFLTVLTVGFVYEWKKGALEW